MKILSLCDYTGAMVQPWLEAGHECWIVDIQHPPGINLDQIRSGNGRLITVGEDITSLNLDWSSFDIVFCFPPCTHLATSGAAHFKRKGLKALIEGLTLVERCREICEELVETRCWFIENPVSTISSYWRKPDHKCHPYYFTKYRKDENYTKTTCLWCGEGFTMPEPAMDESLGPPDKKYIHNQPETKQRANIRSKTPSGFAQAVYLANKDYVTK